MTGKDIITTPSGTEVDVSNLEPGVKKYVQTVYAAITPDFSKTEYGHAAIALATSVVGAASYGASEKEQTEYLRNCALEIIGTFGAGIVPLLRDELKLSLTDDDLHTIGL